MADKIPDTPKNARARKDKKPGGNPAGETSEIRDAIVGQLVPQSHGGALRHGSLPGGPPGPGRPASALRARARELFDRGLDYVAGPAIDGKVRVVVGFESDEELAEAFYMAHAEQAARQEVGILRFATWSELDDDDRRPWLVGAAKVRRDGKPVAELVMEAGLPDRLRALELTAKYGLGEKNELVVVSPDVQARLGKQADAILRVCPPDVATALVAELRDVWK